jgi:hypothetical protein
MTYEQIHTLFKQRYNQSNWKKFLGEVFANTRLLATPEILTDIDSNVASQVQKLGYITLNENGLERQIAVYEVTLAQGIVLERNRVGLRNLLRKYWKYIDAAFITYHQEESPKWRFTYVSELTGYDADGEFVQLKTEPKRYTYLLGEGESTRTAAERFTTIANKGSKATLEDVKEAFSVEKLSKAFFDEYKKHYDIFCDFMVSKPNIRQTIFNGDEKAIHDFVKKLLGRIIFLYFIQKKGWLGVPEKEDWGKGDFDFLTKQFQNFKNQDLFYQNFLSPLFFDTLNQKRDNDIALFLNHGNPNDPKNHGSDNCRIPYLNGGLFEEDDKKHRNLIFPANLFQNLFDFFNQYNFTIYEDDPNDHTVAVDPEMLGHIFENLLEDNKDKGAFYTPKEIVHYMCQESLIEYLVTYCQNIEWNDLGITLIESEQRQWIESLIKKKEAALIESSQSKKSYQSWFRHLNTALDSVKICDPAIGSGAFPMGLLHEIFTAKQTLHTFEHGNTKTFDASAVKLNIIQNSIYGVDIEKGAVDIARLRFWLSLIVDEEKPKALPNLDYKIVVGNSLVSKLGNDIIDIDWTLNETSHGLFGADLAKQKGDLLKKISQKQKEFFNPDSDKKKLAVDIRNLKIDLLITQLELMVKTKGIEKQPTATGKAIAKQTEIYLQTMGWKNSVKDLQKLKNNPELPLHFFDWKLDFPEVMNEQVYSSDSQNIFIINQQIEALNKQIEAVNEHLKIQNIQTEILHLQTNVTQAQVDVVKIQLQKLEEVVAEIFGEINKVNGTITPELDESFTYKLAAINTGIEQINQKADVLNDKIPNRNPNIGFDIVIGNPPYGFRTVLSKEEKDYFRKIRKIEFSSGDSAELFVKITFDTLVKSKGVQTFIIPKKSLYGDAWEDTRLNYWKKYNLIFILDTGKSFDNVLLEASVFCLKKEQADSNVKVSFLAKDVINEVGKFPLFELFAESNTLQVYKAQFPKSIIKKIDTIKSKEKLVEGTLGLAIGTDFFSDEKTDYKLLKGIDIQKYIVRSHRYLKNKQKLKWENAEVFLKPKVVAQVIVAHIDNPYPHLKITACYDEEGIIITNTLMSFELNEKVNDKFWLVYLNSKFTSWYAYNFIYARAIRTMHFYDFYIQQVPIPNISLKEQQPFINLANQILTHKSEGKDTTLLEQEIDNLVYKLYELTYDEVKVIDPAFSLTQEEYEAIKLA